VHERYRQTTDWQTTDGRATAYSEREFTFANNGSLLPAGWLTVTWGLTACTPGPAPGPTLGIEYGKAFTYFSVHVRYVLSPVCLSVCLSVARARYSGGCNFRHKYFYGIWYVGHPLTSTNNFTEIVPGEPLRRGFKQNIGSQILDLSKAISRKRCEIGGKLMLITNRIEVAY